jgi:hypothetical protein
MTSKSVSSGTCSAHNIKRFRKLYIYIVTDRIVDNVSHHPTSKVPKSIMQNWNGSTF